MVNFTTFDWTGIYVQNDFLWLSNIVNYENSSNLILSEVFLFEFMYRSAFKLVYFFTNNQSYFSTLDNLLLISLDENNFEVLYKNVLIDFYLNLLNTFLNLNYFYFLDYKNYIVLFYFFNPELIIAFWDFYYMYFNEYVFNFNVSAVTDVYTTKFDTNVLNFLIYFKWLFFSIFFIFFLSNISRINSIKVFNNFFFTRIFFYSYSFFKEFRVQFELGIQFFTFVIFFWIFLLMSYNDSQVESIEMLHLFVFYFFLFIILTLIVKYSVHYFSFLEASVIEGKGASFILKQFVRDMSNTFALFLRFFLLLFRLNIYDGLDDFLDSYYIFFCDFDEDNYYDELLVLFDDNLFFYTDNNADANLFNDLESDLFEDLFQKYYVTWGKFFMFWAFILEEAFRVSLALYISYLIIFEVHSINASYNEDSYFINKKTN